MAINNSATWLHLLYTIGGKLNEKDICKLKFLYQDIIPINSYGITNTGLAFIQVLKDKAAIKKDNLKDFLHKLNTIGKYRLATEIIALEKSQEINKEFDGTLENIEKWYTMLLKIGIGLKYKSIRHLNWKCLGIHVDSPSSIEAHDAGLHLIQTLIDRKSITPNDLQCLQTNLPLVDENKFVTEIEEYLKDLKEAKDGVIDNKYLLETTERETHRNSSQLSIAESNDFTDKDYCDISDAELNDTELAIKDYNKTDCNSGMQSNSRSEQKFQNSSELEISKQLKEDTENLPPNSIIPVPQSCSPPRPVAVVLEAFDELEIKPQLREDTDNLLPNSIIPVPCFPLCPGTGFIETYGEFVEASANEINSSASIGTFDKEAAVDDNFYPMSADPCGRCLIFNNHFTTPVIIGDKRLNSRKGTSRDEDRLKDLFERLNFEVQICPNQTAEEMIETLASEAQDEKKEKHNCMVVFILSHGIEDGIHGSCGNIITIKKLCKLFSGANCKLLIGKPILFFIQACQGDEDGKIIQLESKLQFDAPKSIAADADVLVFVATTPGTGSVRDIEDGSWFIQELCEVFEKNANEKSLSNLLTEVKHKLSGKRSHSQDGNPFGMIPNIRHNTLRKDILFRTTDDFAGYKKHSISFC